MRTVYMLRDDEGRHYIGETANLEERLKQHQAGGTQTTRRMTGRLTLVAARSFESDNDARSTERRLKSWKNPAQARAFLNNQSA